MSCDLPNHWFVARVVNDHLDGQSIVNIDEEGVGLIAIKPRGIHLGQSTNECREIHIFAADMCINKDSIHKSEYSCALSITLQRALISTSERALYYSRYSTRT